MPIVSKTFDYKRQQRNGTWNVREAHLDAKGGWHTKSYNSPTEAEAITALANRDMTEDLKALEAEDFRFHLENGGAVGDFQFSDLTRAQAKALVRGFFADERSDVNARRAVLDAMIAQVS